MATKGCRPLPAVIQSRRATFQPPVRIALWTPTPHPHRGAGSPPIRFSGERNGVDTERDWIERARQGDQAAFTQLVETYQVPVYNLAYRMLGDPMEAEEAAQETFLRAYRELHRYDPTRKFSAWLLAIAAHHCIDLLRRRRLTWLSLEEETLQAAGWTGPEAGPETDPEQAVEQAEREAQVQALLTTLPPDYRMAIVLRYWYDLSYEEIAQMTESTVSAVKSRLFRARRMLARAAQQAGLVPNAPRPASEPA